MPVNNVAEKQITAESAWYQTPLVYAVILSCFFLSGFASLIYQILWVRMIDKVIGSAPFAVASVLAVFMGGLALGSYLAGKYIDKITPRRKLLSLYGIIEVAIGIYGLLIPLLIILAKPIYASAYNLLFEYFRTYQVFTLLGCSLLLIIPTALMGVTLPVLCRFYVIHLDHLGERTGVYTELIPWVRPQVPCCAAFSSSTVSAYGGHFLPPRQLTSSWASYAFYWAKGCCLFLCRHLKKIIPAKISL